MSIHCFFGKHFPESFEEKSKYEITSGTKCRLCGKVISYRTIYENQERLLDEIKERKAWFSEKCEGPLTVKMIRECPTYWPEDEVIAEKLLQEINELKKLISKDSV